VTSPCLSRISGERDDASRTFRRRVTVGTPPKTSGHANSCAHRPHNTWLIFHRGFLYGLPNHFGHVCTADGQQCVRWDAAGELSSHKSPKAAAVKLRKR